jgi:hypothetical protein
MMYPRRIETVHLEKLDDELCIYDWEHMKVHALNPTAALVWTMCDGQTEPQQMAEKLQVELNTPHAEDLVWLTLNRLEQARLLEGKDITPSSYKGITRRQMLKQLGVAAVLLPVVSSIVAPGPVAAQSPGNTVGTWQPIGQTCSAGADPFDNLDLPASQLDLDAAVLCGGAFNALVLNTNINDCAACHTAAVAAGADWYRFGASEVGLCQAHECLGGAGGAGKGRKYKR